MNPYHAGLLTEAREHVVDLATIEGDPDLANLAKRIDAALAEHGGGR